MTDLLTTRQLEDLLQVDRVTIYRMLDDGRLKGFKVGGQWRFSRAEVEEWLQQQRPDQELASAAESSQAAPGPLPLPCVQAIQSVFAGALGVAATTAAPGGEPLTQVSNSCRFCDLVRSSGEGAARCAAAWRAQPDGAPHRCHAGLLCAGAPVVVEGERVALAVACQFLPEGDGAARQGWQRGLPSLATALGLSQAELEAAAATVPELSPAQQARLPRLLRQLAGTYAEISHERLALLGRLRRIAALTTFQA